MQPPAPVFSDPSRSAKHFAQGRRIHDAGDGGEAWRVVSGVVRLDTLQEEHTEAVFAGMALTGDVVGAEALLFGKFTFRATALTPCVLTSWPGAAVTETTSLLRTLARAERRAASVVALRAGQAIDRVRCLIRLLATAEEGDELAMLPTLRDMADITALTRETVSRALSSLHRQGIFEPAGQRRGGGRKLCRRIEFDPTASA